MRARRRCASAAASSGAAGRPTGPASATRPRSRAEARRLGLDLDLGPPPRDLRAVGAADLRGLDWRLAAGRARTSRGPARPDGRRQHVPQPGPHREARDDARPRQRRAGRPRHRRRLVRARARGLRHRLRGERRRAARPARRGGRADAPAARRRALRPRRAASTGSDDAAPRAAPGPGAPADPRRRLRADARRCGPWPAGPTPGTRTATVDEVAARDAILREHCAAVGRDPRDDRADGELPDRHPRRPGRGGARVRARCCATTACPTPGNVPTLLGPPEAVAAAIRPYVDLGFATIIVRLPAPYDAETIDRIGEVRAALAG